MTGLDVFIASAGQSSLLKKGNGHLRAGRGSIAPRLDPLRRCSHGEHISLARMFVNSDSETLRGLSLEIKAAPERLFRKTTLWMMNTSH